MVVLHFHKRQFVPLRLFAGPFARKVLRVFVARKARGTLLEQTFVCLLYTSDAADEL